MVDKIIKSLAHEFEKVVKKEVKMSKESKTSDSDFAFMRINLRTANLPACSVHPEPTKKSDHVFVIHGKGNSENALYFCVDCQRQLLERLLRDVLTFPGLKAQMGPIIVPVEAAAALTTAGA